MMTSKIRSASAIVIAGLVILGIGQSLQAGSINLNNSGWSASWSPGFNGNLSLSVDNVGTNSVTIEKFAAFNPSDLSPDHKFAEPKVITFQQTSASAKPLVIITDEQIANKTGFDWSGFKYTILDGTTGTASDTRFDVAATGIGTAGGFNISPFTSASFTQNDQILTLSGGIVPSSPAANNVWFPGGGPGGGQLVIAAHPNLGGNFETFSLKEQPNVVIPLPAAVWTGMSGLVVLAILGSIRKLRSRMS